MARCGAEVRPELSPGAEFFARSTFTRADVILAAFRHTIDDLPEQARARVVPFPEIGLDPAMFHAGERRPPFSSDGPFRFLFRGTPRPLQGA